MGRLSCDVLIVDDDPQVAASMRDGVRVSGYSVCGLAASVDEAVDLMRRHRPRLAIIDVNLGGGDDGIEAARRLLAIGPIGIIYVTGYPDQVRGADVGHAWMPKPYRLLDLVNALEVVKQLRDRHPVTAPVPAELRLLA
jgi:DNA-binding response OmpR family regulator